MLRRSHRKSKDGCLDCKRRHIKCDEIQPECVNCRTASLSCSFSGRERSPEGSNIRFITSTGPSKSSSIASNTPPSTSENHPPPASPQPYVNLLHLELFHHFTVDMKGLLFSRENTEETISKIVKYALSSPFLMYQTLSVSSLHLRTSHPSRAQSLKDESARLQTEALQMFNDSVKEITAENVIPAFFYSALLGFHYFCDTFSMPSESLDNFLDRLVQSIRLLQGVRAVLDGWWEFLLNSEIKPLIHQGEPAIDKNDDVVQHLEQLYGHITESSVLDHPQSKAYEEAMRHMIWVYKCQPSSEVEDETFSMWMMTTWPIMVPAEYANLLAQRKPEALIILSYYAVLVHKCREFWAIGEGGRFMLDVLEAYLGEEWNTWLAWPRSVIHLSG